MAEDNKVEHPKPPAADPVEKKPHNSVVSDEYRQALEALGPNLGKRLLRFAEQELTNQSKGTSKGRRRSKHGAK